MLGAIWFALFGRENAPPKRGLRLVAFATPLSIRVVGEGQTRGYQRAG
jgi:hypothetical protein